MSKFVTDGGMSKFVTERAEDQRRRKGDAVARRVQILRYNIPEDDLAHIAGLATDKILGLILPKSGVVYLL